MDFANEWNNKNLHDRKLALSYFVDNPNAPGQADYLNIVKAPKNWGVYASNGPNFKFAIFGRDSIAVADDLLTTHKQLVKEIIFSLARLQGTGNDDDTEEEPGKIHHEYRSLRFDGIVIPDYSQGILRNLQKLWGNEGTDSMLYYGTYDATPLYVRLVLKFVEFYGPEILEDIYEAKDGESRTIRDSLRYAMGWVVYKLNESSIGLLEYKRINPHGIENQIWKDSRTGLLCRDGTMPNFNHGIASIELQGYAYDALIYASRHIAENNEQAVYWQSMASTISQKVINWYWMEDVGYFAQALFFDENHEKMQVDSLTSDVGLLLNSLLLGDLRPVDRDFYLSKISEMIMSPEFLTEVGIRSRAIRHKDIPGFVDYHGSYTVWHKESNEIAKGLRSHGLNTLAANIEKRLIDAILTSGEFPEFFFVDDQDKVWYDKQAAIENFSKMTSDGHLPIPEPGQAWTISAIYRICLNENLKKVYPVEALERPIVDKLQSVN